MYNKNPQDQCIGEGKTAVNILCDNFTQSRREYPKKEFFYESVLALRAADCLCSRCGQILSQEHHPFGLHEVTALQAVEIHAARQSVRVELYGTPAERELFVHQCCDLFSEYVIDLQ